MEWLKSQCWQSMESSSKRCWAGALVVATAYGPATLFPARFEPANEVSTEEP